MSEQESGQVSEQEKEAIEYIKAFQKDLYGASEKNLMAIYIDRVWNYIEKLQKENEESKELYNKLFNGYNKLVQEYLELEKTIDLIIDDFQMENYFVGMTNKEVQEYYKKRKELEE